MRLSSGAEAEIAVPQKEILSMPAYTSAREAEALRKTKMELQSLQTQASMRRLKTSETLKDLVAYVNNNMKNDRLIYPDKMNPFKPKKMCTIL